MNESFESQYIYVPEVSKLNQKVKKLPVTPSGLRFPVNGNIDVNLEYLPEIESSSIVPELEASGEYEVTSFGPSDPTQDSPKGTRLISGLCSQNIFARAVHISYFQHYPLRLTADVLWFTVLQGLSNHLKLHPTLDQKLFPKRDLKAHYRINKLKPKSRRNRSPDKSQKKEDSSVTSLKQNYRGYLKEIYSKVSISQGDVFGNLCEESFSTSMSRNRIAFKIATQATSRHLFRAQSSKGCGIPFIELIGKVDDWIKLRKKVKKLLSFPGIKLDFWKEALMPVLSELTVAAQGEPNLPFFASICNICSSSGKNKPMSGWLQCFFPYLVKGPLDHRLVRNENMIGWKKSYDMAVKSSRNGKLMFSGNFDKEFLNSIDRGVHISNIPNGLSEIKFDLVSEKEFQDKENKNWYTIEKREKFLFMSGLQYIVQHSKTRAIEPVFGWCTLRPS